MLFYVDAGGGALAVVIECTNRSARVSHRMHMHETAMHMHDRRARTVLQQGGGGVEVKLSYNMIR